MGCAHRFNLWPQLCSLHGGEVGLRPTRLYLSHMVTSVPTGTCASAWSYSNASNVCGGHAGRVVTKQELTGEASTSTHGKASMAVRPATQSSG